MIEWPTYLFRRSDKLVGLNDMILPPQFVFDVLAPLSGNASRPDPLAHCAVL
jgi:hypothetical protein